MGLDTNGVKFLLAAKASGVCFKNVATIGRQQLHLGLKVLKTNLRLFNFNKTDLEVKNLLLEENGYVDSLLRMLGAVRICSIDASSYEGASFIHDMNRKIPNDLKNAFTVVIDGGSLEHIFDFPTAIKNCMEMVQIGGHFLSITPVNNFMGHGFYQFSPELFFRLFTKDNGFNLERAMLFESRPKASWYKVVDPDLVGKRIDFVNAYPTYLLVQAKKINPNLVFLSVPQQGYYTKSWHDYTKEQSENLYTGLKDSAAVAVDVNRHINCRKINQFATAVNVGKKTMQRITLQVRQYIPGPIKVIYRTAWRASRRPFKSEFFKEIDMTTLVKGNN
jgi:hypothetical protein